MKNDNDLRPTTNEEQLEVAEEQLDQVAGGRMAAGAETAAKTSSVTKCCW